MKGNIDPSKLEAMRAQVGAWLREKREEKGLSQLELADKMWIKQETVSKVESGRWAITVDMLTLFCHHLGIPLEKMLTHGND
jgi:transcriptional regulator with XRE-family HTH domain